MQTKVGTLYGKHQCTWLCREGWERRKQHEAAEAARIALARTFTAYGEDLERVEVCYRPLDIPGKEEQINVVLFVNEI
jgi:hypothetical protein